MKKYYVLLAVVFGAHSAFSQSDTLIGESDVTISASKWAQKISEVPNHIIKITNKDISTGQPQTAADLLQQSGKVFIQKSQLAGGSPMIRGFATNRVLLVIDGVRMNNAIYRSGNLQNIISIDPLAIRNAEVIFGPGTMVYGSDAIGGVMSFNTLQPVLQADGAKGLRVKGNALVRFSTANREQTFHADVSMGSKRFAYLSSVTFSSFDDLKMGRNGGQDNYLRPEYVQRINNRDSIVKNSDPYRQVFSGYDQWNVLQKIRFKASDAIDLQYAFSFGQTGTSPRYDRLIEYRNGLPRFAEWNYGPMLWRMHTLSAAFSKANGLFDEARLVAGYQNYEESRMDRARNALLRRTQQENVVQWNLNFDATKKTSKGRLNYGAEYVDNLVNSAGWTDDINTGDRNGTASRYPDGSTWRALGIYGTYKHEFKNKMTLQSGLRYNKGELRAEFDDTFFPFPYRDAHINDGALTGSLGVAYKASETWQINGVVNTGFRMPNIDDMGKLFETSPGLVVVPNPNLESEYAWNFELGIIHEERGKFKFELVGFHSRLTNAIVRRPFTFNGADSIPINGIMGKVESLQNIGLATVWGIQFAADFRISETIGAYLNANWTDGAETDDVKNEQVPLRHAPPFFGNAGIRWQKNGFRFEIFGFYNSEVSYENLAPSEQQKPLIYAKDEQGRPYCPAWYSLNTRAGYQWKQFNLNLAWENMTNQRYRAYSSGIVAAGSNFICSLSFNF
ncbi:MAG: TonB-dependent receptor [Chitinophagaceae bacterium]|nr:TonB-dependent receptor [Chitinophagaceae bacterium]